MIKTVKMIGVSDLRQAINFQYDIDASDIDIALAFGKDSRIEGAHLIYFGPDLDSALDLENCLITYLRDTLPDDESIYINFSD